MKFIITISTEENPDAVGEFLRSEFFWEDMKEVAGLGCYNHFVWHPCVRRLEPMPVDLSESLDPDSGLMWARGTRPAPGRALNKQEFIECRWYWEGDGTLLFILPDKSQLINTDCKKTSGWEFYQPEEKAHA